MIFKILVFSLSTYKRVQNNVPVFLEVGHALFCQKKRSEAPSKMTQKSKVRWGGSCNSSLLKGVDYGQVDVIVTVPTLCMLKN
jgi:hypothetical protein